jgi:hypothetical protein
LDGLALAGYEYDTKKDWTIFISVVSTDIRDGVFSFITWVEKIDPPEEDNSGEQN